MAPNGWRPSPAGWRRMRWWARDGPSTTTWGRAEWCEHGNVSPENGPSFCSTAIRRDGWADLLKQCTARNDPYVDSRLWRSAKCSKRAYDPNITGFRHTVGMKGMPGTPGYGHNHTIEQTRDMTPDPSMLRLRELIGDAAQAYEKFLIMSKERTPKPPPPVTPFDVSEYRRQWVEFEAKFRAENEDRAPNPLHPDIRRLFDEFRGAIKPVEIADPSSSSSPPTVEVHVLTRNEEAMLPYTLRHYQTFAQKIVVHDAFSTDRTREIATAAGAQVVDFDTKDKVDDELHIRMKNTCWRGTTADWVICVDCDELVYWPGGVTNALAAYEAAGVPMIHPHGFEMFTEAALTTKGQIYEQVKVGAPDNKWYAKPVMFSTLRVTASNFGIGCHTASPMLKNGVKLRFDENTPFTEPPCYLLHFHHIWPIAEIAAKYDRTRARLTANNVAHHFGNLEPGIKHAMDKRTFILKNLMEVITP